MILNDINEIKYLNNFRNKRTKLDCESICDMTNFDICNNAMMISDDDLIVWNYFNWILMIFSILQFIGNQLVYYNSLKKKMRNMTVVPLISDGSNGQFNFARDYYEYFANHDSTDKEEEILNEES